MDSGVLSSDNLPFRVLTNVGKMDSYLNVWVLFGVN